MKKSIKVLIAITIISVFGMSLKAQNANTGLYLSEQDYKLNKLSYVLKDHDKLRLNEFLDGKKIDLIYQRKKISFSKREIFGYRKDNHSFRFFHNEAYKILDTTGFLLYSCVKLKQGPKGCKPAEKYFYSIGPQQPVEELTIQNLWNSFPRQTNFRYSLQSNFNNDSDLIKYDKLANQYKIKYLFFEQKRLMTADATF